MLWIATKSLMNSHTWEWLRNEPSLLRKSIGVKTSNFFVDNFPSRMDECEAKGSLHRTKHQWNKLLINSTEKKQVIDSSGFKKKGF